MQYTRILFVVLAASVAFTACASGSSSGRFAANVCQATRALVEAKAPQIPKSVAELKAKNDALRVYYESLRALTPPAASGSSDAWRGDIDDLLNVYREQLRLARRYPGLVDIPPTATPPASIRRRYDRLELDAIAYAGVLRLAMFRVGITRCR